MPHPLRAILLGSALALLSACSDAGTGTVDSNLSCRTDAECPTGERCTSSVCRVPRYQPECDAGDRRCNGDAVERCGADRFWAFEERCSLGCSSGACIPQACTPLEQRCRGRYLEQCRGDGALWLVTEDCTVGCDPEALACRPPVCASGELKCDGRAVVRCNVRRSGWDVLEQCATFCDPLTTACVPGTLCTDRDRRCSGNELLGCSPSGVSWIVTARCDERCDSLTLACAPFVCGPGSRACVGAVPAICNTDGSGWSLGETCAGGCEAGACVGG